MPTPRPRDEGLLGHPLPPLYATHASRSPAPSPPIPVSSRPLLDEISPRPERSSSPPSCVSTAKGRAAPRHLVGATPRRPVRRSPRSIEPHAPQERRPPHRIAASR